MDKMGNPFGKAKPELDRKRETNIDAMAPIQRVSSQMADTISPVTKSDQFMGGTKDLTSQIPMKK